MDIFIQELKRQFYFKRIIIYLLIPIILSILWATYIVKSDSVDFMQLGIYKNYSGEAAIKRAAKDRRGTEGKMDKEKFQRACNIFLDSLKGDNETDIKVNKNLLKYAVYADVLVTQEDRLREMRNESTKGLLHIKKNAGENFYKNENLYYRNYIDKNAHNESEKKLAVSLWNKVKKPYTYYSSFNEWTTVNTHIILFSFILMIIVSIFSSSIIAKDKESGIDEIISATMKGRKKLVFSKISIPLILSFISFGIGIGIYILLLRYLLPVAGLKTSIQIASANFIPYTQEDVLKNEIIFGIIGTLTFASFTTWISSIVKKVSTAIQLSVLLLLVSLILGLLVTSEVPVISFIRTVIPGGILFSSGQIFLTGKFPLTSILGKSFWIPSILIIVNVTIFLFSIMFSSLNYRRR